MGRFWLVLERGVAPSLCIEDPCLAEERYVYIEADVRALYPIARGMRDWSAAMLDGSVLVFGAPTLVEALPGWFASGTAGEPASGHDRRSAISGAPAITPFEVSRR